MRIPLPVPAFLALEFLHDHVYLRVSGLKLPIAKAEAWKLIAGEGGEEVDGKGRSGGELSPAEKRGVKVRAAFRAKFEAGQCRQCGKKRAGEHAYCRAHLAQIRTRLAKARAVKAKAKTP